MIAKDFHSTKDFRQIRGKSFVITDCATVSGGLSGHTRHGPGWARQDKSRGPRGGAGHAASEDDVKRERRRAAAPDQPGDLMPVDAVGRGGLRQRQRDA
jgi:hypothetical protein